ncbi:response regulator [Novosphingobium sp. G106]|uniref:response regulator transcription factor n=1 Tax=Novosphingobium sp. G106 TaxID=2849500 RepID=UPI001C2D756E|nr:response regulator [Novosphingobium sp. G106]MBV1688504.1 response regulator [Novosphingobium sp. G106]
MTARILIVDDDTATLSMLSDFVEAEGYLSEIAVNGEEALLLLGAVSPDIILLDAVMPGLDGFETCRLIKGREGAAHVPVIFMTGLSETAHVVQGLEAGGVDYVTKPLALDALAARIRVHLGNARTTRSALTALDSAGTRLLSCDDSGKIGWATPEAQRLLDELDLAAVEAMRDLLREMALSDAPATDDSQPTFDCGGQRFLVTLLGPAAPGEHLFKLTRSTRGIEPQLLQQAFGLTPREADVLLWTARGKSNKDMSEILNISARTVNKHLEQIFIKIGIENRASATAAAAQVIFRSQ